MDLIDEKSVWLDVEIATRDEMLAFLSAHAVKLGIAEDEGALLSSFLEREAEGSTGMIEGFAIPHAKNRTVHRAAVMVVRSSRPIADWESMDDRPITVAVALLVPDAEAGSTHLELLSAVAVALMRADFRERIRGALGAAEVSCLVNERLER